MCGICGFTMACGDSADHTILKAMCDVMAHRGPDGEGRYIADGIAFGHRRLSLIDLAGGGQPMIRQSDGFASEVWTPAVLFEHTRGEAAEVSDGTPTQAAPMRRGAFSIVFNGEIYNYRELRKELEGQGYAFATDSDTEVLLVGYIAWSRDVLKRLRGMFAFAIYNAKTRELFCARDFFGIKPFYYTVQNGQFIFASEIKAILEHPAYTREVNEDALAQYLCFQFSALPETFFKGIYKLPQGHCMLVSDDGAISLECYWRPEPRPDDALSESEVVDRISQAMADSVRFHNVADVEVGSFLSSGIDSSYLTALLLQENPAIQTFTVGFSEYRAERDEISWAHELADRLDVANDAHHIDAEEYWSAIPLVQWHMDEPSADPSAVALFFVDKLAARHVKAVLSGEGADELFGGYRIYQVPLANEQLGMVPKRLLRAGSKLLHAAHMRGANYLERASEGPEDWYYTNANGVAFTAAERDALLASDVMEHLGACGRATPQQVVASTYAEVAQLDEVMRMQHVDMRFWLVEDILLKTDKMSMAHSLESRVPFLDREVFEVARIIPREQKVTSDQTKVALREAAQRDVPRDWAQKEKLGFPVPLADWLRDARFLSAVECEFASAEAKRFFNASVLQDLLDGHRAGTDNSRRIWIIYSFLVWYRIYFVEQVASEV